MPITTIYSSCGCMIPIRYNLASTYVAEDSTVADYKPYVDQYGKYYVPSDMSEEQVKFIEVAEAPDLNAMSYFIGVQDNGDGTGTDYKFTPEQLQGYFAQKFATFNVVATAGNSVTLPAQYTGSRIALINNGTQTYNSGKFNQPMGNDTATMTNSTTFANGQILTITLGV